MCVIWVIIACVFVERGSATVHDYFLKDGVCFSRSGGKATWIPAAADAFSPGSM